jgi:hypothetical protein
MCLRFLKIAVTTALLGTASVATSDSPDQRIYAIYDATVSGPNVSCHVEGSAMLDESLELFVPCSDHRVSIRPKFQDEETYTSVVSVDALLDGKWNALFAAISEEAKLSESQTMNYGVKDVAIQLTLILNQESQ